MIVQVELSVKGTLLLSDRGMCSRKPFDTTPVAIVISESEKMIRAGLPPDRLVDIVTSRRDPPDSAQSVRNAKLFTRTMGARMSLRRYDQGAEDAPSLCAAVPLISPIVLPARSECCRPSGKTGRTLRRRL